VSRAFVREDAGVEIEAVAERAPLPDGAANLVTPRGWRLLIGERAELDLELRRREDDGAPTDAVVARLGALDARIASARVVQGNLPDGTVRFGAKVGVVAIGPGASADRRWITIVGVDEADPATGRIAHLSPMATALMGARAGDVVSFSGAGVDRLVRVVAVTNADD
jgi:transcription elongation factor GreB